MIIRNWQLLLPMAMFLFPLLMQGQESRSLVDNYLHTYATENGLDQEDMNHYVISDEFETRHNGVTHVHIRQTYSGIEIHHGVANFAIKNGAVVHMVSRLQKNIAQRVETTQPTLTPAQAISAAATALGLNAPSGIRELEEERTNRYLFSKGGISLENIPVKLMYLPGPEGELFLVWDLSIYPLDAQHWWSVRVDALSGTLLDKLDWVVSCDFPMHPTTKHSHDSHGDIAEIQMAKPMMIPGTYNVFPYTIESPNHGPRALIVEPADSLASPFGWHDTDATAGAEFTITRGNNVYASEDRDADNVPGYSPDGGAALNFDFPLNINQTPENYEDVSITNLFYMNNIMHDLWYQYGFDEASGNFQENNYGKGGQGTDYVNADAQDGGGTNNANFGTPADGGNPRMQMFLWDATAAGNDIFFANSPSTLAGPYTAVGAGFGPSLTPTPITADLVLVDDGTPDIEDACEPLINGSEVNGKIALINRGNCTFASKVLTAQNAGAIAVVIANNVGGAPFTMPGNGAGITIPSVMISQVDGNTLRAAIQAGDTVNVTLVDSVGSFQIDGDFDNGIIAHEYGHGISNRLTGGPGAAGCLGNAEQMGEGWSDYFAIVMNLDTNVLDRGVGTFAIDEPITGVGIRPAPYSPDFAVNDFTYDDTNSPGLTSQPHGIGFVWCTMLWDLTLAFVDQYGYDPNVYTGTGGNNMAMQLVIDGLKLQPCGPGFVDGRDAILMADQINNGGANECLIWEVFAKRGLGADAMQGSAGSRTDQVEAFNLPNTCLIATVPPIAVFGFEVTTSCNNRVEFTDQSTNIPQFYFWDFGDGNTDTVENPVHIYTVSGTYTVTEIVTNNVGSDTFLQTIDIVFPDGPMLADVSICADQFAEFDVQANGVYRWYDVNGTLLDSGATFQTPILTADTTFFVEETIIYAPDSVGPVDGSFATGGYHNTGFTGTLNFTASTEFTIVSVWLDAGSSGPRTISLWNGIDGGGNLVDQVTIDIPAGPQRVTLNLEVPGAGTFSVGGSGIDLFRNNTGAMYPYEIPGVVSIFSSSATTDPNGFYYYLYDWEVQRPSCISEREPANVLVTSAAFDTDQDSLVKDVTFTDLSQGATSWVWDFGDGDSSTLQNPVHTYASVGEYTVTLTVNGLCTLVDTILVTPSVGIGELAPDLAVSLTPNPAQEEVWVNLSRALPTTLEISLYTIEGKQLNTLSLEAGSTRKAIDLTNVSPGVYFLQLQSEVGREVLRLVVTN